MDESKSFPCKGVLPNLFLPLPSNSDDKSNTRKRRTTTRKTKRPTHHYYRCFVLGCGNSQTKNFNGTYFKFPGDKKVRQKWIDLCQLSPENFRSKMWICSVHFENYWFGNSNRRLFKNALPTLFLPSTSHCYVERNRENAINLAQSTPKVTTTTNSTQNEVIEEDYEQNVDPFQDIAAIDSECTSSDVSNISVDFEVSSYVLGNGADQDDNISDDNSSSNHKSFSNKLAKWAVTFSISKRCIEALLKILREEKLYVPATATKLTALNKISNTRQPVIDDQEKRNASKLIFFDKEGNQKDVFLTRFSNPRAKPHNLEEGIEFMKPYIESEVKKNITDNCKKFIKTIRNYPSLYSFNTPDCTNSTIWEEVASDMSWTVEDCSGIWKKIKDQFEERIARKTFNKDWEFRNDLLFLKFSYMFDEFSIDNLPRISEDVDLNSFLNEIKKYPCLYDLKLRAANREIIWDIIGKPLNLSGEECKKYWGRLSSIYIEYMDRKSKEVPNAKVSKFEIEMQFLKPFRKDSINQDAKTIKESRNPIENVSKSNNLSQSSSESNDRLRKHKRVTKYIIPLDNESTNNASEDDSIDKSEPVCEDEYILSDCAPSPLGKTLEVIANALVESNSNVGDDCFTITKLCSDSESDNNNDDEDSDNEAENRNDVHHPKQHRVEQYFFSTHNIMKKRKTYLRTNLNNA